MNTRYMCSVRREGLAAQRTEPSLLTYERKCKLYFQNITKGMGRILVYFS